MRTVFLLFCFVIISCKKNRDNIIDITGKVTNEISHSLISNILVKLEVKNYGGTSFSNIYEDIDLTTTASDGSYSFSFENRNAIDYKLTFSNKDIYDLELFINPDNLSLEEINIYDQGLYTKSYLIFNITNVNSFNQQDHINLNFANTVLVDPGPGECFANIISLPGLVVDTTIACHIYGDQYVNYDYHVTKNNITNSYSGNIFCVAGDTVEKTINY